MVQISEDRTRFFSLSKYLLNPVITAWLRISE